MKRLLRPIYRQFGLRRNARLLAGSPLFDADWYLSAYPDVAASGLDPIRHYLVAGAAEGRDPGPSFVTAHYLAANPDVAAAKFNPLVHYVRYGRAEGRRLTPDGSDFAYGTGWPLTYEQEQLAARFRRLAPLPLY